MVKTVLWYFLGWTGLVLSYPVLLLIKWHELRGQTKQQQNLVNRISRRLARYLFRLTGSTVRLSGLDNLPPSGAVLFVSNHQGHMDSLIIQGFIERPKGFISIVEVLRYPIIRTWMKQIRCVFLDRENARQSAACINQAVDQLKEGHSMVVFPEGRLSDGPEVGPFQRGWLRLATKSGVPIVPISISGSYRVLAKDGSRVDAAQVDCVISPAMRPKDLKKVDEAAFIEAVRQQILSHVHPKTEG